MGIVKEEVINIINLLREERILADTKDLSAFIKRGENKNRSLNIVEAYSKIESFLLTEFEEQEKDFHIKELNEKAEKNGCDKVNVTRIKTLINFWAIKKWIERQNASYSKNHLVVLCLHPKELLMGKLKKRHELAKFIVEFLYEKSKQDEVKEATAKEEVLVEFSEHELKDAYEHSVNLFKINGEQEKQCMMKKEVPGRK